MNLRTRLLALPVLAAGLAAQEPSGSAPEGMDMSPAAELKKFEPMIGSWEGEGTSHGQGPDAPSIRWTAREQVAWVLGGHFAEANTTVQFPGGEMPPLHLRSFMGYDRERGRHVRFGANSMGRAGFREIRWAPDGAIVVVGTGVQGDLPTCEREIVRFGKDRYDFTVEGAVGAGPFGIHVQGTMRRVGDAVPAEAGAGSAKGLAPANPEIGKLSRLLGTWKVKGTMVPAPGAPPMPISGRETNELGFGGAVVVQHVEGDPTPMGPDMPPMSYEAWGFAHWNADRRCYESFYADNMGTVGSLEAWFTSPDEYVFCASGPMMGTPSSGRAVLRFAGDATIQLTSDRFYGTGPAIRDFEATYARAK